MQLALHPQRNSRLLTVYPDYGKPQMGIGNYWRVSHEFLLLGVRGNAKSFAQKNHLSWMECPRGKHSAKPDEVRQIIEHVSPGPFLELFGRKPVEGWTVFGNQIAATNERSPLASRQVSVAS